MNRKLCFVSVLCFALALLIACPSSASAAGTVTLSPSSYNFGTVAAGTGSAWASFKLANTGASAVTISSAAVSGPFVVSNQCGSSVAAASSCVIYVYFAPTSSSAATGTLTVTDGAGTQTAALSGNSGSTTPTVATPVLSPGSESFTTSASVTISDSTSGATIYYTTNGTTPTTGSTKYSSAITVSATETIEAIAVKSGSTNSPVASATYTKGTTACATAPGSSTLSDSNITSSGLSLSWTTPSEGTGCTLSGYTVHVGSSTYSVAAGTTTYTATGLTASTAYNIYVTAANSKGSTNSNTLSITTLQPNTPGTTTGTISFHLWLGVSSPEDSLTLDGGNFNDLIMSNFIAGVMYGHLIEEGYPGMQFNKDYIYGSIMGQLLQENTDTEVYSSSSNLIDSTPNQQSVMYSGQGGPYQINSYVEDLVAGNYSGSGHALVNYIALQKNIGYTVAGDSAQQALNTPPSFNNKYYGPMLPAYFHYNDMVALQLIGTGTYGWQTDWQPAYDETLTNFVKLPNSFLDVLLNAAYNQGYYGPLVQSYSNLGATATAATVATVNSYSTIWGISDTYKQYPYQVHYYLDQMYDNPIPSTSATATVIPANHIAFGMSELESVFTNVFELMSYSNGTAASQFFTAAQAQAAFNAALASNGVAGSASLDLSTASQRAQIFAIIDAAISNLETTSGMKFNTTTTSEL